MKVKISGREYDMAGLQSAHLSDLILLKQQTGLGVIALQSGLSGLDGDEMTDDALISLGALVWLTRRRAGEKGLTLEQACDFPLDELELVPDVADEVVPESPDPS